MELSRIGANRKERLVKLISITNTNPSWDYETQTIKINARNLTDPSLSGEYNYMLTLNLNDIVDIINKLATSGIAESSPALQESLTPASHALLRLIVLASGLGLAPEPKKTRLQQQLSERHQQP